MSTRTPNAEVSEAVVSALLDCLIPAAGNLPSAGNMGLATEVIRLAGGQPRFWGLFTRAIATFNSTNSEFVKLTGDDQDLAIRSFEVDHPDLFGALLDISYIVYYKDPRVHERIGWEGKPPQPDGNVMTPWDESVLDSARKREPFWRRV
ncbi:MAG: hypothetical protein O3B95_06990 [Chloroflexi bacterium]|nr:hypothetical protein [Chloroflexota bacterium]